MTILILLDVMPLLDPSAWLAGLMQAVVAEVTHSLASWRDARPVVVVLPPPSGTEFLEVRMTASETPPLWLG